MLVSGLKKNTVSVSTCSAVQAVIKQAALSAGMALRLHLQKQRDLKMNGVEGLLHRSLSSFTFVPDIGGEAFKSSLFSDCSPLVSVCGRMAMFLRYTGEWPAALALCFITTLRPALAVR